jgi:hypothetical protein
MDRDNNFPPGIAILIDCWAHCAPRSPIYENTWKNIEFALQEKNIKTVVLATHEYDITTHWTTQWFTNTHHIFFNGNKNKNSWVQSLPQGIGTAPGYIYQTADSILNIKTDALKLMIHDPDQLIWYLDEIVPHIKAVWYFGIHWDICLKVRNIGYMKLKFPLAQRGCEIFTDTKCVVTIEDQRPNVTGMVDWQHIVGTSYKLKV